MAHLAGKVCLVTGGSRGIGRAVALELGRHGASVAVGYSQNADAAEAVAAEITTSGGEAFAFGCNVQDLGAVEAAVESIIERTGKIDVLVNNAGVTRDRSLSKMSREEWDDVIDTNLGSVFNLTSRVLPHMVKAGYGRVISISSVVGLHGNFGQTNYAASKAGSIGFTKSAALELARKGITVNAIAPGFTATEMVEAMPEEVRNRILEKVPMGRFGRPEEIAQTVDFLISNEYITGQVIVVDGGLFT